MTDAHAVVLNVEAAGEPTQAEVKAVATVGKIVPVVFTVDGKGGGDGRAEAELAVTD